MDDRIVYPDEAIASFNANREKIFGGKDRILVDLIHIAESLQPPRAVTFLREGVLRRFGIIHRCAENVFSIYPPERKELLNQNELTDLGINVQAFLVNVYGILDNVAWVCALAGGFPDPDTNRLQIGLFKPKMKPYFPATLAKYVDEGSSKTWHDDYAKIFRDSTAHRITPYIPPSSVTEKDVERLRELDHEARMALREHRFEQYVLLEQEKRGVGKVSPYVVLATCGEMDWGRPIVLHPQMLCDLMTVHELLQKLAEGLRETYGIPPCPLMEAGVNQSEF